LVPPDEPLPLRPRLPVGIRGGAVVEHAAVRRPRPRPLGGREALLPVRLPPRRLVDPVRERAAVDPATAARGAVGFEPLVPREQLPLLVPAADLLQHRLGARLLEPGVRRIVPREVLDRAVLRVVGLLQALLDALPEVVVEPEVGAAILLRLDR